jgi:DNA-binding CsgD family transcriptional regulator
LRILHDANETLGCILTVRERQITALVAVGLANKEIACQLRLSEGTVKVHLNNIFRKTGVKNRTALTLRFYAYSNANGQSQELVEVQRVHPGDTLCALAKRECPAPDRRAVKSREASRLLLQALEREGADPYALPGAQIIRLEQRIPNRNS